MKGIYAIKHNNTIIYIGQSVNIEKRWKKHLECDYNIAEIKKQIKKENGKCNRTKQLALYEYIKANKNEIKFEVILETEELNKWEEYYITKYLPQFNYKGVDIPY